MQIAIDGKSLELTKGDITAMETDAVVNAANSGLVLGAGVAGAIRKNGGPAIQEACDKIGGCPVGKAVITTGGLLKSGYVIHAVGPRMGEGNEDAKLASATRSSLEVAAANGVSSIAFPAISTGIFGFPVEKCAQIMLNEALEYLRSHSKPSRIVFCLFSSDTYEIFKKTLERYVGEKGLS